MPDIPSRIVETYETACEELRAKIAYFEELRREEPENPSLQQLIADLRAELDRLKG